MQTHNNVLFVFGQQASRFRACTNNKYTWGPFFVHVNCDFGIWHWRATRCTRMVETLSDWRRFVLTLKPFGCGERAQAMGLVWRWLVKLRMTPGNLDLYQFTHPYISCWWCYTHKYTHTHTGTPMLSVQVHSVSPVPPPPRDNMDVTLHVVEGWKRPYPKIQNDHFIALPYSNINNLIKRWFRPS